MQSRRVLRSLIRQLVVEELRKSDASTFKFPTSYRGAKVSVVDSIPTVAGNLWVAQWILNEKLDIEIFFEQEYVDRLLKFALKSPDEAKVILNRVLEHEYAEATMTFTRAMQQLEKEGYTTIKAQQYARLAFTGFNIIRWFEQLGGEIHYEIEPARGSAYKQSANDLRTLGYKLSKRIHG